VHTGVTQASSSVELSGDVIAKGDIANNEIGNITMFLQLTSGGSVVDMGKTLIVYSSPNKAPTELLNGSTANVTNFNITSRYNNNTDFIVDRGEKFQVLIDVGSLDNVGPNNDFQVEIKPPSGAPYVLHRKAPPSIDAIMTLV
jgi:flagellin FlaB